MHLVFLLFIFHFPTALLILKLFSPPHLHFNLSWLFPQTNHVYVDANIDIGSVLQTKPIGCGSILHKALLQGYYRRKHNYHASRITKAVCLNSHTIIQNLLQLFPTEALSAHANQVLCPSPQFISSRFLLPTPSLLQTPLCSPSVHLLLFSLASSVPL